MGPSFVFGATGYTGRSIVEALALQERPVVAHVRPGSSSQEVVDALADQPAVTVDRSPWKAAALDVALRRLRPSMVFTCLGTTRKRGKSDGSTYESVDYGLTHMVLTCAGHMATRPHFVYLSAAGADRPSNAYMRVRTRIEKELADSGLSYTIVRPAFISGDRDESRPMEAFGAVAFDGLLKAAGALGARTLRQRYRSITGERLGRAMVVLAREDRAAGRSATYDGEALQDAAERFMAR